MNFDPVCTKADLETLDQAAIVDGYRSAERGDPEPGPNRGRAYWHGWRNRMIDLGELPGDEASRQLAHEMYIELWSDIMGVAEFRRSWSASK